ncbi:MAG: VOC family protein [Chloroflexi bacterium]|nr:VOC family protein [Chloroflexota bacterium]
MKNVPDADIRRHGPVACRRHGPGACRRHVPEACLALWPHRLLAADSGLSAEGLGAYHGFTLAYNARSREDVDTIFAQLRERGADIAKRPVETDWGGYSGYFTDPDGHHWEVAYNPFWPIRDDGRIEFPVDEPA